MALQLHSSEQYSVHRFSICRSSARHFPERFWTVVTFPCFTVVKSFTSWYALLLLFFLRFSSISLHCYLIQPSSPDNSPFSHTEFFRQLSVFALSSSFSLHCSPIQFPLAFFMHLLTLLFTSLYFSDPSGSDLFFSVVSFCRTDQEFLQ